MLSGVISGNQSYSGHCVVPDGQSVEFVQGQVAFAPGSVVHVGRESDGIIVGDGASLEAQGTTFTARCDWMWSGITVRATARGFSIGRAGDDLSSPLPDPLPANSGDRTESEISHAEFGVYWEDPSATQLRVLHTHFRNNLRGLTTGDLTRGNANTQVARGSAVLNNAFDSDPVAFLMPQNTGDVISYVHLDLGAWTYGNELPIAGNKFRRGLVSILQKSSLLRTATLTVGPNNSFSSSPLAGVGSFNLVHDEWLHVEQNVFVAYNRTAPSTRLLDAFHTAYPTLPHTMKPLLLRRGGLAVCFRPAPARDG